MADIDDDLLREFACEVLQAQRMSGQYLQALRVVLGNQARAERTDYLLELNRRVDFAPARVMRTIVDQMKAAGLTTDRQVSLGAGRTQTIQCYAPPPRRRGTAGVELEMMLRREEAEADAKRDLHGSLPNPLPVGCSPEDVPY